MCNNWLSAKGGEPCVIAFATFRGVSTPTMAQLSCHYDPSDYRVGKRDTQLSDTGTSQESPAKCCFIV